MSTLPSRTSPTLSASGSLQPQLGGAIIAQGESRDALQPRAAANPFVQEDVVTAEILEVTPAKADHLLAFLIPWET